MNLKSLFIVIGVLVAASLAVFLANRSSEPAATDPRVGAELVDQATIEKTSRIRLSDQGKTVTLTKQADGSWQVADYFGFPADFSKLSQFVEELQKAKIDRFVTANPERLSRFEFKDTKISLLDGSDKELWSVTLGKYAEGGGRVLHYANETKAYLSHLNAWMDPEAKNWADSSLANFKADDIAQVEISFPDSAPVIVKRAKKEDVFSAEKRADGSALKGDKISALLSSLSSLRFSDTSATDDAKVADARKSSRTVKFTRFDGKTLSMTLGRKPEQKILKAPEPAKDGKTTGPAAILGKTGTEVLGINATPSTAQKEGPTKAIEAATETIPAGPVYVFITDSDTKAPINVLMQKRAFQINDYTFTSLPQKAEDLFQAPATK